MKTEMYIAHTHNKNYEWERLGAIVNVYKINQHSDENYIEIW